LINDSALVNNRYCFTGASDIVLASSIAFFSNFSITGGNVQIVNCKMLKLNDLFLAL
jgi:hypothetical protein